MGCGFFGCFLFVLFFAVKFFFLILFCMYESFAQVLYMCTMYMHGPQGGSKTALGPLNWMVMSTVWALGIESKSSARVTKNLGYYSWSLTCRDNS